MVSIVAVAGVSTVPPEEWDDGAGGTWLTSFPTNIIPHASVFVFDHGICYDGPSEWIELLDQGSDLLEALLLLKSENILVSNMLEKGMCVDVESYFPVLRSLSPIASVVSY